MIWFNAPPISSITSATSAARPVGSVCRVASAFMSRTAGLAAWWWGSALTELVAATTRVFMEAMAEVKVEPAVVLSSAVEAEEREAAVESVGMMR